jgi:hypothetical protein
MKIKAQDKHAKVLFYLFTQMQRFETVSETACGVGPLYKIQPPISISAIFG